MAFRPPEPAPGAPAGGELAGGAPALSAPVDALETARTRARNDPRVVASVVRNWTGGNG
jgi:hypothetical protein